MPRSDATRPVRPTSLACCAAAALMIGGCHDDASGPGVDVDEPEDFDTPEAPLVLAEYLEALPSWDEFSPPLMKQEADVVDEAEPQQSEETVEDVERVDDDGNLEPLGDVTYDCTETPYSMTDNPGQLIVADPNRDVLYPGAFIQGKTHRDAISIGDVLPLTIDKRAPVRVSVPDVSNPSSENFRQVQPSQAEVAQAIGDIVGTATQDDLQTPSSISFEMQTFHSEEQFALEAGLSGRYLGFSASASGSVENDASTTTVAVQFTQRMFTAVVEPPGSGPEAFFASDFTGDDLQALIDSGRLGPENLPVYVSSVVYGRMMTFAMTSTASEAEIKAALRASYDTVAGGVSASLSAKNRTLLEESTVVLTTLGGDAADALRVIRSGDWAEYFNQEASLSTAVPLSYTFKNLGDNSIASVSEASEFVVKTCKARQPTPGLFDISPGQQFDLGAGEISQIVVADENGDGLDDLLFNSRSTHNRVALLRATADSGFEHTLTYEHSAEPDAGTWSGYALQAGDVDGDGDADLVWNRNGSCYTDECLGNTFYVALAGGGTHTTAPGFRDLDLQGTHHPQYAGGSYNFFLADVNGDGRADPLLNSVGVRPASEPNFSHVGLSTLGGALRLDDSWQAHSTMAGWLLYETLVDDFNGDGLADVVWNRRGLPHGDNDVHSFFARPENREVPENLVPLDNAFAQQPLLSLPSPGEDGWETFAVLSGDITRGPGAELVWVRTQAENVETQWATSTGAGFVAGEKSDAEALDLEVSAGYFEVRTADVAGSDRADLVLNHIDGGANQIAVGLSVGDGTFDYSAATQDVGGDEPWSQFEVFVGNFGGSAKKDIAWVLPTDQARVYVAIAK